MFPRFTPNYGAQLGHFQGVNYSQVGRGKTPRGKLSNFTDIIFIHFVGCFCARTAFFIRQIVQHIFSSLVRFGLTETCNKKRVICKSKTYLDSHRSHKADETLNPYTFPPHKSYNPSYSIARLYLCLYRKGWKLGVSSALLSCCKFLRVRHEPVKGAKWHE